MDNNSHELETKLKLLLNSLGLVSDQDLVEWADTMILKSNKPPAYLTPISLGAAVDITHDFPELTQAQFSREYSILIAKALLNYISISKFEIAYVEDILWRISNVDRTLMKTERNKSSSFWCDIAMDFNTATTEYQNDLIPVDNDAEIMELGRDIFYNGLNEYIDKNQYTTRPYVNNITIFYHERYSARSGIY